MPAPYARHSILSPACSLSPGKGAAFQQQFQQQLQQVRSSTAARSPCEKQHDIWWPHGICGLWGLRHQAGHAVKLASAGTQASCLLRRASVAKLRECNKLCKAAHKECKITQQSSPLSLNGVIAACTFHMMPHDRMTLRLCCREASLYQAAWTHHVQLPRRLRRTPKRRRRSTSSSSRCLPRPPCIALHDAK